MPLWLIRLYNSLKAKGAISIEVQRLKTLYEEKVKDNLNLVTEYRESGLTMAQTAVKLGIRALEFYEMIRVHQALYTAWYNGETALMDKLENTIRNEALGYYKTETNIEEIKNSFGEVVSTKKKTIKRWHRPQPSLLLAALKATHPGKWTEQRETENRVEMILPEELEEYSK